LVSYEKLRKSYWARVPFIFAFGMLAIVSHYTTGALVMGYMGAGVVLIAILKRMRVPLEIPWRVFTVAAVLIVAGGVAYYGTISSGTALHDIIRIVSGGAQLQAMLPQLSPEIAPPQLPPGTVIPTPAPGPIPGSPGMVVPVTPPYSPLMQTALGLDFMSVSVWGKLFRVFQLLTQIFLVVGVLYYSGDHICININPNTLNLVSLESTKIIPGDRSTEPWWRTPRLSEVVSRYFPESPNSCVMPLR